MKRIPLYLLLALLVCSCSGAKKSVRGRGDNESGRTIEYRDEERGKRPTRPADTGTGVAADIEREARRWLGTRYRYGGKDLSGTDCSGMVMMVYLKAAGVKLPRDSRSQQQFCKPIKRKELCCGDLVFFASKSGGSRVSHVGIYLRDGDFIHASSSRGVIVSNLEQSYYARHYHSSGRVPGLGDGINKEQQPFEEPLPVIFDPIPEPEPVPEPTPIEPLPEPNPIRYEVVDSLPYAAPAPLPAVTTVKSDTVRVAEPAPSAEADSIRAQVRKAMSF